MASRRKTLNSQKGESDQQTSAFAYRIHWTKEVRGWDQAKRGEILRAVRKIVEGKTFAASRTERKFRITQVDDGIYSGPSLLALLDVLRAFEEF